jgi:anti-sigma B factor antagonist
MKLEVTSHDQGPTRTIVVKGDVDMDSSPELRDEIKKSLKGPTTLRLDLKAVGYIDSSGIAVLITGYRLAQKAKVGFRLLDPSAQVKAVIELSQLQSFFPIDVSAG